MERVTMLLCVFCSLVIMNEVLFAQSENVKECDVKTSALCKTSTCRQNCSCSDIFFWDTISKKCISANQTLKDEVIVTRNTDSVTFMWPGNLSSNNEVYLKQKNFLGRDLNSSVTVKDLEPGTEYIFRISSFFKLLEPTEQSLIIYNYTVWTKPEKPGPVTSVQEANITNEYNIVFNASIGTDLQYTFSVTRLVDNTEQCLISLRETTVRNCKLDPGQLYFYTIKACISKSDCSEKFTGNFTTNDKSSDPVTNLTVKVKSSSEATVMWQPPTKSNGKILHYLLTVASLGGDSNPSVFRVNVNEQTCKVDNQTCEVNETSDDGSDYQCSDRLNCTTANTNSKDNFSAIVSGLKACTNYSVNVTAVNGAGAGRINTTEFTTEPDVAAAVQAVHLNSSRNESSRQITLSASWAPGVCANDTTYTVIVQKAVSRNSTNFSDLDPKEELTDYAETFYRKESVQAYWRYQVCVQAKIYNKNHGAQKCSEIVTEQNNPGYVQNLNVSQHEKNAQNYTLHFTCPPEIEQNGNITGYFIKKTQADEIQPQPQIIEHNSTSCIIDYSSGGLIVGKNYTFAVMARNDRYNGSYSKPFFLRVKSKKPIVREKNGMEVISSEQDGNKDTDSGMVISVCRECLLDSSQGVVINAGLVVCVVSDGCNMTVLSGELNFSAIGTWAQSRTRAFIDPYRATSDNWLINLKTVESKSQDFEVGVDTNCGSEPDTTYCNGPLPTGRNFEVSAVVCTDGGCTQFNYDKPFMKKASEDSHTGTHVALALGTLVAAALLGVLIFLVLRQMAPQVLERICEWNGKSVSYAPEKRFTRPVKIKDFEKHVQKLHKDSNLLFQDEFESVKKISSTFKRSSDEAKKESNRVKNRYVDILPYDHSRVKLDVQPEEDETNDFINANYIPGYNSVREYIATQGPMHCTVVDFWRMLWEQKSQVIVMLSDLQENGKLKVDQYWPDTIDEPVNFDNVVVELTNFSQMNKFIIRNFKVSKGDDIRKLTQFFLPGWWDFSANLNFLDVIEFVKLIRQENTPEPSGPIIVHCSAGVGRTGTLIALDYFIQYVEEHSLDEYVDIFSYVLLMRKNRPRMVQAESQYIFIYDAVLEIIKQKIARETDDDLKEVLTNGRLTSESPQKPCVCLDVQGTEEGKCVYTNKALEPENPKSEHENPAPELENPAPKLDNPPPKLDNAASELDNPAPELDNPAPKLDNPTSELDNPAPHKVRFMNEYSSLGPCPDAELVSFCQK